MHINICTKNMKEFPEDIFLLIKLKKNGFAIIYDDS